MPDLFSRIDFYNIELESMYYHLIVDEYYYTDTASPNAQISTEKANSKRMIRQNILVKKVVQKREETEAASCTRCLKHNKTVLSTLMSVCVLLLGWCLFWLYTAFGVRVYLWSEMSWLYLILGVSRSFVDY